MSAVLSKWALGRAMEPFVEGAAGELLFSEAQHLVTLRSAFTPKLQVTKCRIQQAEISIMLHLPASLLIERAEQGCGRYARV